MRWLRLCLVLALARPLLSMAPLASVAHAQTAQQTVHVVQPGENLSVIALRYGTTVNAIVAANGLSSGDWIYVGQRLLVPKPFGLPVPGNAPTTGSAYVVQRGDTPSGIALKHGVTVWALMQANGLSGSRWIYAGQRLIIPRPGVATPTPTEQASQTYTVRPGDTLSAIAQRFETTTYVLARINSLADPSAIYVGQVLRVTPVAPPAPLGGGKHIVISLSQQYLYAYEAGRLVYSFVCSSGAAPYYTRSGEFRVQSKIPNAYGAAWGIWMPHWLGIYWAGGTENGIHALPTMRNGETLWAGYLGRPVSYGCIVLGTANAQTLYDWADIGTPVSIRQ